MRNRGPRRREGGFSLLEILIALTLVAMMAVALWSVFRISVASWKKGIDAIESNQRQRSILNLVRKQMASIFGLMTPPDLQAGGVSYPVFSGAEDSMQFVSLNSLRFQENPGLTMVSYDLVQDRQGGSILVEREAQYLGLDSTRDSYFDRTDETFLTVFENLTSFSFEYFDPATNERPAQWMREWNAREMQRLPVAISMTMTAQDAAGRSVSRHIVIPVMAKPHDMRPLFVNPFDSRPRRFRDDADRPY
jgi:general secretion pathway protein J